MRSAPGPFRTSFLPIVKGRDGAPTRSRDLQSFLDGLRLAVNSLPTSEPCLRVFLSLGGPGVASCRRDKPGGFAFCPSSQLRRRSVLRASLLALRSGNLFPQQRAQPAWAMLRPAATLPPTTTHPSATNHCPNQFSPALQSEPFFGQKSLVNRRPSTDCKPCPIIDHQAPGEQKRRPALVRPAPIC